MMSIARFFGPRWARLIKTHGQVAVVGSITSLKPSRFRWERAFPFSLGSLDDELVAGVGQAVQGGRPDQSKYSGWQISSKPTKRSLNSVPCSGEKEVAAPA